MTIRDGRWKLVTSMFIAAFTVTACTESCVMNDQREGAQAGQGLAAPASQEAHAAGLALTPTYADLCLRLDNGRWLQAIVVQRDRHGHEWHECVYGRER